MYSQIHTFGECRRSILKMLERYSSNGALNCCGELEDIENRLVECINANMRKLYAEFVRCVEKKALVFHSPEILYEYSPLYIEKDTEFCGNFPGKSFSFYIEVCGSGDVVFGSADRIDTYSFDTATGETKILKGTLNGTSEENVSFTVNASSDVNLYSFVIYRGGSPDYIMPKGCCKARLPDNCAQLISITDERGNLVDKHLFDVSPWDMSITTRTENAGRYIIEYYAYPERLCEDCGDDANIKLPGVLFDALCYMCASDLCPSSEGELYSKLLYKYREILENYYDGAKNHASHRNSFYRLCGKIHRNSSIKAMTKYKTEG